MQRFLDKLKSLAQTAPVPRFSVDYLFLPQVLWRDARIVMVLAMLNAVWCVWRAGIFRRRCLLALMVTYGICVALIYFLVATARLPERVSYNIPLFFNAICLYWALGFHGRSGASPTRSWEARASRMAALILIPIWCFLYLFSVYELDHSLQL